MKFALIENNKIKTIIISNQLEINKRKGEWVKIDKLKKLNSTFDRIKKRFIDPKPFPSWILNDATGKWYAPKKIPNKPRQYWNEASLSWKTGI